MAFEFTSTGLTIQTYQEIYDELVAGYEAIYGSDINTDADSPDGQRIGIEAKARLDLQTFALALYSQMDPDAAVGEWLNVLIKFAGIARRAATRSQVDVTVTVDRDLTLPDGYTVNDELDQAWITTAEEACTIGANVITLVAEEYGAVEADADTVNDPADIILGVVSVTNAAIATAGVDEETDQELRIRRNLSLLAPSTSSAGGMFTALGNVANVTDVAVYENATNDYDSDLALNPHSLWCIVEGGATSDIAEAMVKAKTAGTGLKGSVSDTYDETLYRPDLTPYTLTHTMYFDRPTTVDMYIHLTVEGIAGAYVDKDRIKAALAALTFSIGDAVTAGDLYATVYSAASNFTATDLEVSDDGVTYTDGRLSPGADGVFSVSAANITITDIT